MYEFLGVPLLFVADVVVVSQEELDKFYDAFRQSSRDGKAVTLSEFSAVFETMGIKDPLIVENTFHGSLRIVVQ